MKKLEEDGPSWTLDAAEIADDISVQLIGPAYSKQQLLQMLDNTGTVRVSRRVLLEWFDFLRTFGIPALYGACPTAAAASGLGAADPADAPFDEFSSPSDGDDGGGGGGGDGVGDGGGEGIPMVFLDRILDFGEENRAEGERHLAEIATSTAGYAETHHEAADAVRDGGERDCYSEASRIVATDSRANSENEMNLHAAKNTVAQLNREREQAAKEAGRGAHIAYIHTGEAVNDFQHSTFLYAAHASLFPNGRGLMEDSTRSFTLGQQEFNQHIFGLHNRLWGE